MVKVITEEIQNVQISNCRFDAPRKFHELFWNWNQIRRSRKKQSCIDFALNFFKADDEFDDRYLISLDFDELQNFIDW